MGRILITEAEREAKPQVYAATDPKAAVRNALQNLGWTRGEGLMSHMSGPVGYERFTEVFVALIEEFEKRAKNG